MRRIRLRVLAAAAVACLVLSAGVPAAGARAHAPGRPGLFGATVFPAAGQTVEQAIADWQAAVGRTVQARKQYYPAGVFPTVADDKIQAFIDLHQTAYLCYKPSFAPPSQADADKLIASLRAFIAAGLPASRIVLILWQELDNGQDITGPQVIAGYRFYVPRVRAAIPGVRVAIDFPGHGFSTGYASANPGPGYYDYVLVDEYAISWVNGSNGIPAAVSIAHSEGKPWGMGEMGISIGSGPVPTDEQATGFLSYITSLARQDVKAGRPLNAFMWYQQPSQNLHNVIPGYASFAVPALDTLADTVTGSAR